MRNKGFTLVELMIVIAIIAIIAAVAIPSLIRSKMSANEASAVSTMKTIATANIAFAASRLLDADTNGQGEFAPTLAVLNVPPNNSPAFLPDDVLATSGQKAGYTFTYAPGANAEVNFTILGDPTQPGVTGLQQYFTDESVVIRFAIGGQANATSPPVS